MFELASHFRIQYFIYLTSISLIYFFSGKALLGVGASFFALINLRLLVPYYKKKQENSTEKNSHRFLLANILKRNKSYERVRRYIQEANPDFLVLIEVSEKWLEELQCISAEYPFVKSAPRKDDYGLAIFSRVPIKTSDILYFGDRNRPTIFVQLDMEDKPVTLIAPHPSPPKNKKEATLRNRQLLEIADLIANQQGAKILIGDLNITPWSPIFRDLLERSSLKDSRIGFGLQPTWPTTMPPLYIPIDHILVSSEISILNHQTGPRIGSDHLPVIVDFSL